MQKLEEKYSKPWRKEKKRPSPRVAISEKQHEMRSEERREEWHQVTVAPEVSRTKVFKSGTFQGESGEIPAGGQSEPISTAGEREKCK